MTYACSESPPNFRLFARRCQQQLLSPYRARRVAGHVEYVSGPDRTTLRPTDLVVLCLVRDGEGHLEHFVEHYLRLGARLLVLLDNGSVDNTMAIASKLGNVVLLRCNLPYRTYQYEFRRYLVNRFGSESWSLVVDIDERFDYPLSDRLPLRQFLAYLNENQYTAVPAQLLDLFPEGPLHTWPSGGRALFEASQWYDISSVSEFMPRLDGLSNLYSAPPRHLKGGIRQLAFGIEPTLTKYPLVYGPARARPVSYSAHFCQGARVADISCLLAHYKFDSAFQQRCRDAIRQRNYYDNSREYRAYLRVLGSEPAMVLKRPTARRFQGVNELVNTGFVTVSEPYSAHVRQFAGRAAGSAIPSGRDAKSDIP